MTTTNSKGQNNAFSSSSDETLTSLPPPFLSETPSNSLPFDLVTEILCRLPVKHLLQLRCVCKSWNSLISHDSKFARKHLRLSTSNHDRHHLNITSINSSYEFLLSDYPISSIFCSVSPTHATQFSYPLFVKFICGVTTCDGMLCFMVNHALALLCNPSIRIFNVLPPLNNPYQKYVPNCTLVYDRFTNTYKIIAVIFFNNDKNQVNIHTLGTHYWRKIHDLPYKHFISRPGIFVSDTVNWLMYDPPTATEVIVSFDLEKESYQTLWQPLPQQFKVFNTLNMLRDCLCILSHACCHQFSDVWIMKEYGNEQSWTKLLRIPHTAPGFYTHSNALYISKDDQVMLDCILEKGIKKSLKNSLLIYDSVNNTSKFPEIQNINNWMTSKIYVESLISPFSKS